MTPLSDATVLVPMYHRVLPRKILATPILDIIYVASYIEVGVRLCMIIR